MCKKLGIGVGILVALFALAAWTGLSSYTATAWSSIQKQVKGQVPLEFELERLRHEVAQLDPEMNRHISSIASEIVQVENLRQEIATTRENLAKRKQELLTMSEGLEKGSKFVTYDGRPYPAERVQKKLERDWASYQLAEAELKSKEELLAAKEQSLDVAREQLVAMRTLKHDLEVQIAQLEAELKSLRLAQAKDEFHFDHGQLSKCQGMLAEIKNRLATERKTLELRAEFTADPIPVHKKTKSTHELIKEIREHFGERNASAE
ncbi:MAG: hypothetical protein KatS3mg105_2884 [Gemmatales bacterium]|nr:MAG: hypothetical protein KatS3mg105_2884 [Gemmatales bacterium]